MAAGARVRAPRAARPRPRASRAPTAWRAYLLLSPALVVMVAFFLGAMAILASFGLHHQVRGRSVGGLTLDNFTTVLSSGYHLGVIWRTVRLGLLTTVVCAAVGYPVAYAIHRVRRDAWRRLAYFALFAPLLTSVVVRSYGWQLLLADRGLVNEVLRDLHLITGPLPLLYEFSGVTISLVHIFLPFMVLPILGVLGQIDPALKHAAADLGASRWQTFRKVTLPLSVQGLLVGCEIVLALALGAFATPSLLGGGRVQVLATLIYSGVGDLTWDRAAALSYVLLALALLAIAAFTWLLNRSVLLRAARR